MFCPNCGIQPQVSDQKFCKSCGTNLMIISQALRNPTTFQSPLPPQSSFSAVGTSTLPTVTGHSSSTFEPISLSTVASLPFMQEEAYRQKLRKIGWSLVGGGVLFSILLGIVGGILSDFIGKIGEAIAACSGLGGFIFLAGIFLLFYTRFILKKSDMPPVIVVQQSNMQQPLSSEIPQQSFNQSNVQSSPQPLTSSIPVQIPSLYPPPSVVEHTTERLQIPFIPSNQKDSQQ